MKFFARPEAIAEARASSLPDRLPFSKMEGLGNDYVYMEDFDNRLAGFSGIAALAVSVSDRHFGVGGDGLVLMCRSDRADFRMRMFNADGSEAEMCGNATRCVGKYLYDNGITYKTRFSLETLAGIRLLELNLENGKVASVRVDMGEPVLKPELVPMLADGDSFVGRAVAVQGKSYSGTAVSMGNPHLVVPLDGPDELENLDIAVIGPLFEHHELFPRRVNTEFIRVLGPDRVRMRVWERGSGETMACGTGACAVLVACALNGFTGRRATVELRGGNLEVEWAEDGHVYMTGPAAIVFKGEYILRDR